MSECHAQINRGGTPYLRRIQDTIVWMGGKDCFVPDVTLNKGPVTFSADARCVISSTSARDFLVEVIQTPGNWIDDVEESQTRSTA